MTRIARNEVDFGIITALPIECTAVLSMLDQYETVPASMEDPNRYYRGTLNTKLSPSVTYQIVVALCMKMGNNGAAMIAKDLIRSFRARHVLLVGIAAGVPNLEQPDKHVRLGDVVVSSGAGVVQYDFTKRRPDGSLEIRSTLSPPSAVLSGAVRDLEVKRLLRDDRPWEENLARAGEFADRPPEAEDKLFVPVGAKRLRWKQVKHPGDAERIIGQPRIHSALIGSGNCLMKDVRERDRLAAQVGISAIEMEGAGVADAAWNQTEVSDYLIIRGICDYADRFKNDKWQRYAATAAAAYMRALLEIQPVPVLKKIGDRDFQGAGVQRLPSGEFAHTLDQYLHWVRAMNRNITVRGLQREDGGAVTFPVASTFVSLNSVARTKAAKRAKVSVKLAELSLSPIDFSSLSPSAANVPREAFDHFDTIPIETIVSRSPTAVITGGPGSGKTTVLQYIAYTLSDGLLGNDRTSIQSRLGIVGEVPIPIMAPLNAFAKHLKDRIDSDDPRDRTLLRFLEHYVILRQGNLDLPKEFFSHLLREGRLCLFLLDGLDEIADDTERIQISRAIEDLAQNPFRCIILVTSRTRSYRGDVVLPQEFEEFTIRPLTTSAVNRFLESFCRAFYTDPDEQFHNLHNLEQLVVALEQGRQFSRQNIGPLISNPLMVRMVITLHLSGRSIPDQRAELYQNYVDALILATYHPDVVVANRLSTAGGSLYIQRSLLARIAFEIHKTSEQGCPSLSERDLRVIVSEHLLLTTKDDESKAQMQRFLEATRQRGGLLEERGGEYAFSHPAFEEFLTGRYLVESLRYPEKISAFLKEDRRITRSWWHEPAVLCIGYVSSTSPDTAHHLLQEMIESQQSDHALTLATLEVVGKACIEWQVGSSLRAQLVRKLTENLFDAQMQPDVPLALRAAAGRILGELGDIRDDVATVVPAIIGISDGRFYMGHNFELEKVNLPSLQSGIYEVRVETFALGKYPVTNGQFARFIQEGGYTSKFRSCWTDAGWEWRVSMNVNEPAYWGDSTWNVANHPVVGVSWFEALAYCRWLSQKTGRVFLLPTEAEWERAVKGTDLRAWPWGPQFGHGHANTDETGIGQTTCVGLFPEGQSPFGIYDCAGNVWNWCSSQFRGFGPYDPTDGRESLVGAFPRCIRGGSWLNGKHHARCANRDHYFPADRHFDLGFRIKEKLG